MKSIFSSPWKIASFLYFVYINSNYFLVHVHRWQMLLQINHFKSITFLFSTGEPYSNSDMVQQARDSLLSPSLQPWEAWSKWRPCHLGFDRSCNSQAACNSPVACALSSDVQTSLGAREEVKSSLPAVRGWIAPSPLPAGVGITDEHVPPKAWTESSWTLCGVFHRAWMRQAALLGWDSKSWTAPQCGRTHMKWLSGNPRTQGVHPSWWAHISLRESAELWPVIQEGALCCLSFSLSYERNVCFLSKLNWDKDFVSGIFNSLPLSQRNSGLKYILSSSSECLRYVRISDSDWSLALQNIRKGSVALKELT